MPEILTDREWGYLAGILDGEGCISIYPKKVYDSRPRSKGTYLHLALTVVITNVVRAPLEVFHRQFGGHLQLRKPQAPNCQPLYAWSIVGKRAGEFLKVMRPMLMIKASQADVAIVFSDTIGAALIPHTGVGRGAGGATLPDEVIAIRERCYETLYHTKTKGDRTGIAITRYRGNRRKVA